MKDVPEFPRDIFRRTAEIYARDHDLRRIAARVGAQRTGYRLSSLSAGEVADLVADLAAENVAGRQWAIREMLQSYGGKPQRLENPDTISRSIERASGESIEERARWALLLLQETDQSAWELLDGLRLDHEGEDGDSAADALQTMTVAQKKTFALWQRTRKDRDRLRGEVEVAREESRRLRRKISREVDRRKKWEGRGADLEHELGDVRRELEARRAEVSELHRALQIRESGASGKELRELRAEAGAMGVKHEELVRDYSALVQKLRGLEEKLVDAWSRNRLQEKDLRPSVSAPDLPVTAPNRRDDRAPAEKVRLPAVPHHWPGGQERFVRFLERIARSPHVTRVVPRRFQSTPHHGIAFVTAEGDLVARVSAGDHAAQILILTTAAHHGEGAFVRRELEPVFEANTL